MRPPGAGEDERRAPRRRGCQRLGPPWWLALALQAQRVRADYFPFTGARPLHPAEEGSLPSPPGDGVEVSRHSQMWQPPLLQPWDTLRATYESVQVAWTPAWNPWSDVARYELQSRRPAGYPLELSNHLGLQFRESNLEADQPWSERDANADHLWTAWETDYAGRGRAFVKHVAEATAHAVQFRVRACGPNFLDGCSAWSPVQTTHTVVKAAQDKINMHFIGTGRNAHNYTVIEVNRETIYRRRDETGLVLAAFLRLDFSLQWLRTYDTHRSRNESLQMSKDIRQFNSSYFVVVVSTVAWEWHAPQSLVKTLEFCGAYQFGQWAHIFGEQKHYYSDKSDLQQTGSQQEFGHPYALIGIPGIGSGQGWESLMHNTGHYLPRGVRPQNALIRAVAYYDYVFRIYRLQDVHATTVDFYWKGNPPGWATFHNPVPVSKRALRAISPIPSMTPAYTPYQGSLSTSISKVIEANETVPPHNFAFALVTVGMLRYVDPRPRSYWVTELERIWEGGSARYWAHNGSILHPGLAMEQRRCAGFIYHGYTRASPELCGEDFEACCDSIDAQNMPVTACGLGVAPTLCKNSEEISLTNHSVLGDARWPYDFKVISWSS